VLIAYTLQVFEHLRRRSRATPPPGTTPSSTAALVACIASSTRAFFGHLGFSGRPDLDDRHAAYELGKSLLPAGYNAQRLSRGSRV